MGGTVAISMGGVQAKRLHASGFITPTFLVMRLINFFMYMHTVELHVAGVIESLLAKYLRSTIICVD